MSPEERLVVVARHEVSNKPSSSKLVRVLVSTPDSAGGVANQTACGCRDPDTIATDGNKDCMQCISVSCSGPQYVVKVSL